MQLYQESAEEKPTHSHYNSFADLLSITSGGPLTPSSHSTSPLETTELGRSPSDTSIEPVKKSAEVEVTTTTATATAVEAGGRMIEIELERANQRIVELTVGMTE